MPRRLITLLTFAVFSAVSAASDDRPLDPRLGPAAGEQSQLRLATNGDGWMATWLDNRAGVRDIVVSPLDARGQPRWPEGIPIATMGWCDVAVVQIVWNGLSYSVVWLDRDTVHAVQVSPAGELVRPTAKLLALSPHSGDLALAWNGSRYLVAWTARAGGAFDRYVEAILLDSSFSPATEIVRLSKTAGQHYELRIEAGGGQFLTMWTNRADDTSYQIETTLVAENGQSNLPQVLADVGSSGGRTIAWNGSSWSVVWSGSDGHIRFARIAADGTPAAVHTVLPGDRATWPSVAYDGTNYLVAFISGSDRDAFTLRVTSTGEIVDSEPLLLTNAVGWQQIADLSASPEGVLVGWEDFRAGANIFDALVRPATYGTRPAEQLLASSLEVQRAPAVSFDQALGLVAWSELLDSSVPGVRAIRVSAAGVPLDNPPLELHRGPPSDTIAVAAAADGFLVAWWSNGPDAGRVLIARVTKRGELLDRAPIEIGGVPDGIAVASDGRDFMVVWGAAGNVITAAKIRWSAPDPATSVPIARSTAPNIHLHAPDVVYNGSSFVISWLETTSCGRNCNLQDIYLASVTNDGAFEHSTNLGPAAGPASLATNGRETAVAWPLGGVTLALLDPQAREIARTSTPEGRAPPRDVDLVWNGSRWLAAWTAPEDGLVPECLHDSRSHIEAASFAPDLSGTTAVEITPAGDSAKTPSLASTGSGLLLVYERTVQTAPALHRGGIDRIFLRSLGAARLRATVR